MEARMSIQTRKELLFHILKRYKRANWINKSQILDELVATTGYRRKYAIHLLNLKDKQVPTNKSKRKPNTKKYNEDAKQALITIWCAANCICSKRLVPFIPELLAALERFGHISLPLDVRNLLLKISPATVDRLLETTRKESRKGLSTTCSGSLLKKLRILVNLTSDSYLLDRLNSSHNSIKSLYHSCSILVKACFFFLSDSPFKLS